MEPTYSGSIPDGPQRVEGITLWGAMNHIDLFSGIGGFSLAAKWVWGDEHKVCAFVERDEFCRKVLRKHWPNAPIFPDVTYFNGRGYNGQIDLLTGGFPCQPYSFTGNRRGAKDDRALWPEMFRIIDEVRPRWVLAENVFGFVEMGLEETILNLESIGYETGSFVIPAVSVEADHERNRIWIVAYSDAERRTEHNPSPVYGESQWVISGASCTIGERGLLKSGVDGAVYGLPGRMDRYRIKALGNAIVPQVAANLFEFMKKVDEKFRA